MKTSLNLAVCIYTDDTIVYSFVAIWVLWAQESICQCIWQECQPHFTRTKSDRPDINWGLSLQLPFGPFQTESPWPIAPVSHFQSSRQSVSWADDFRRRAGGSTNISK